MSDDVYNVCAQQRMDETQLISYCTLNNNNKNPYLRITRGD